MATTLHASLLVLVAHHSPFLHFPYHSQYPKQLIYQVSQLALLHFFKRLASGVGELAMLLLYSNTFGKHVHTSVHSFHYYSVVDPGRIVPSQLRDILDERLDFFVHLESSPLTL